MMIPHNKKGSARLALGTLMVAALAACGGGGGGGYFLPATSTPAADTTTVTGVAAVGKPIANSTVELKCASGATASATTDADGAWTASLKSTDYPCAARVPYVDAGNIYSSVYGSIAPIPTTTWLHTFVSAPGTANITPLTDLVVGAIAQQDPAVWFTAANNGTLSGAITPGALAHALAQVRQALATLPGRLTLLDGFDPITSPFSARPGDAADGFLESYGAALKALGLTLSQAATHVAAGQQLTQEAYVATAFTTPNLTAFRVGAALTLQGQYAVSIQDPNRGTTWATAAIDSSTGNLSSVELGPYYGVAAVDQNRVVELCSMNAGTQRSQYVFVSEHLEPVTDPTELQGEYFTEYENCIETGKSRFESDGSFVFTPKGGSADAPDTEVAQAFTPEGAVKQENGGVSVRHAKAFKYTIDGYTKYVYVMVSTRQGSTTPELNGDTDYVLMGVSEMPR
ncbi:MAG: hypothetical protein J7549_02960 [Variovorax sp.]|nr:hypothetical protein [Variovorax sp.]